MLLRDVLSHALKLWPEKEAIIDGDTRYTYRQAADRINRLAAGLHGLGIKPGDNIAILANNSHRYWETYFVADIAGTPLAPLNIRLSAKELEFILNDGEVKALLLGPEYVELYNQFREGTPGVKHAILMGGDAGESFIDYEQLVSSSAP
jgi:acyl-CoA synthetase (AMP-forming)/AMP-acid ligase II